MRMLVLNGSYRAPLMFNDETLDGAEKGLERIKSALKAAQPAAPGAAPEAMAALEKQTAATREAFVAAMDDDFNAAGALGGIFELVRAINAARDAGASDSQLKPAQDTIRELAGVFGLRLSEKIGSGDADKFIDLLLEVRAEVRAQKLWALSDLIRDRLKALGVTVEDSKQGSTWHW